MSQDDFISKDDPATASLLPGGHYDSAAVARAKSLIETMPDRIGRYRILERLGGGGMGEVYVAEQTEPIKRRVALKVIKAGMDTRQVVARFEAERQALAMMDHPNIARVIDAGATETGQPYFVMELVRGIPITQFADANKLSTRQRVELMVPVCQAVQHAHQKGIIHRDIKPHNVLVTLHDGKPVPKVIDFGIAKATSQSLTDKTVYTEFRAMIGTPAYMSPEQAEMSGLDIDTRSDIYSLGVLAYELLTGSPPFDSERLVKAGLGEIQRIIREEDPPRPSIRFSTMGDRLTTVATYRSTEPARLSKLVAGELDWIVMRAMEKDRKRRYDTASDLAADLNRHLGGEPVVAAPPTWGYRTRKIIRKHRNVVVAASVIAAALTAGVIGTSWEWHIARISSRQATEASNQFKETVEFATAEMSELLKKTGTSSQDIRAYTRTDQHGQPSEFGFSPHPGDADSSTLSFVGENRKPMSSAKAMIRLMAMAAEENFNEAQSEREKAEMEAYTADLALAQSAMANGNWPEARTRLDACPHSRRRFEWYFLRNQAKSVLRSFPINAVSAEFNNDGSRLLAVSTDRMVTIWDASTAKLVGKPIGPVVSYDSFSKRPWARAAAFSKDGKRALTVNGIYAQLWDSATGESVGVPFGIPTQVTESSSSKEIRYFQGDLSRIGPDLFANFSEDGKYVCVHDVAALCLYDADDGHPIGVPIVPDGGVQCFYNTVWNSNAHYIVVESTGFKATQLWNSFTGNIIKKDCEYEGSSPIFNSDGSRIFLVPQGRSTVAEILDTSTGVQLGHSMVHGSEIRCVQADSNAGVIATQSLDGIKVWGIDDGEPIASLPATPAEQGGGWVKDAEFSPDGAKLLSYGQDGAQLWDTRSWSAIGAMLPWQLKCHEGVFDPDSKHLYMKCVSGGIQRWSTLDGQAIGRPIMWQRYVDPESFTFTKSGCQVFTSDRHGSNNHWQYVSENLWSTEGKLCGRIQSADHSGEVSSFVTLSPDGRTAVIKHNGVLLKMSLDNFDLPISELEDQQFADAEIGSAMANDPPSPSRNTTVANQRFKASLTSEHVLQIKNTEDDQLIASIGSKDGPISSFSISPDGSRLVTGVESAVKLYETTSFKEVATLPFSAQISELFFSPDGTRLIVRRSDRISEILDTRSLSDRQGDWAAQESCRQAAQDYVQKLLNSNVHTADLKRTIFEDRSQTPQFKLIVLEEVTRSILQCNEKVDSIFKEITSKIPLRENVTAEAQKRANGRIRDLLLEKISNWSSKDEFAAYLGVADSGDNAGLRREDYELAIVAANACLKHDPQNFAAAEALGAIYFQTGQYDSAIRTLAPLSIQERLKESDRKKVLARIAISSYRTGRIEEARVALHKAIPLRDDTMDQVWTAECNEAAALIDPAATRPAGTQPATRP